MQEMTSPVTMLLRDSLHHKTHSHLFVFRIYPSFSTMRALWDGDLDGFLFFYTPMI